MSLADTSTQRVSSRQLQAAGPDTVALRCNCKLQSKAYAVICPGRQAGRHVPAGSALPVAHAPTHVFTWQAPPVCQHRAMKRACAPATAAYKTRFETDNLC
jgi:hypothetical protein